MAKNKGNSSGPFATLFAWIGVIAGGAAGLETGEFGGMCVGAFIMGVAGFWIGRVVDWAVGWLIFVAVSIIALMINAAIRRFVWDMISSIAG